MSIAWYMLCEAKPTTFKRPSPGDSFENHIHSIETCGSVKCNFHLIGQPPYLKSCHFINASLMNG